MIDYRSDLTGIEPSQLHGFFVDWPHPPSPELHLEILRGSHAVELALDDDRVVGFANAISDGVLAAFIPLLEVLPDYHGRGVGTQLMQRLLGRLEDLYMVDLCCDAGLEAFYTRLGLRPLDRAMGLRNYEAAARA